MGDVLVRDFVSGGFSLEVVGSTTDFFQMKTRRA